MGGTKLRALVTGYFQPLIAVVLLTSHSPSPLGLPPPLPSQAKASDGLHIFKEDESPLTQLSLQRLHRQVSGAKQAFGLGGRGWLGGWLGL